MCDLIDALLYLILMSLQFAVWINPWTFEEKKKKNLVLLGCQATTENLNYTALHLVSGRG